MIYNQIVTWTAFAILAMFLLQLNLTYMNRILNLASVINIGYSSTITSQLSPTSWSWWDPPEWQGPLASQSLGRAFRQPFHLFTFAFKTILSLHLPHSEGSQLLKGEIKREPVSDVSLVVPIHLCSMLCKKYKMFNSMIVFRPVPTLGSSSSML